MEQDNNFSIINRIRSLTVDFITKLGRPEHLFSFDKKKCALLIIDMQNFACISDNEETFPNIDLIINNINKLAQFSRMSNIPVIWIKHNFIIKNNENDAGLYPVFHGMKLNPNICNFNAGTDIYDKMDFDNSTDIAITKNRYSAFIPGSSKLPNILKSLGKSQLIVAGLASNVCVESTIRDAMQIDYEVTLIRDATSTFDDILKEVTLANIKLFFGDVKTTDEIINELELNAQVTE